MMKPNDRILVVDDSADIRFLISSLLQSLGYEPVEAANGVQALDVLKKDGRVRLVLTDYLMPQMDGLELTRQIRSDEQLEDLPVLMQTSNALDNLEGRAAAAGVTRLLPKTLSLKALMSEIAAVLHDDRAGRSRRALLIGLPSEAEATIRRTLSEAGFHVLQVPDEMQAAALLQRVDGIDLAFVSHTHPEGGRLIRVHLLRTSKDYELFRLILVLSATNAEQPFRTGLASVAVYLVGPVSAEKVKSLLGRLGVAPLSARSG